MTIADSCVVQWRSPTTKQKMVMRNIAQEVLVLSPRRLREHGCLLVERKEGGERRGLQGCDCRDVEEHNEHACQFGGWARGALENMVGDEPCRMLIVANHDKGSRMETPIVERSLVSSGDIVT